MSAAAAAPAAAAAAAFTEGELAGVLKRIDPSKIKALWFALQKERVGDELYDNVDTDGTDTDRDQEARDTLIAFVHMIYPTWFNQSKPQTRTCASCQKHERPCIEVCEPATGEWRCLWRTFSGGDRAVTASSARKPAESSRASATKRKQPTVVSTGDRPAAAAAGASSPAAAAASTLEHVSSAASDESPLKKRRVARAPKPKAAAVVKSKAAPTGLAELLTQHLPALPYDVLNVVSGYAIEACTSGFCTGTLHGETLAICVMCPGTGFFCRGCMVVHEHSERHRASMARAEELRLINIEMDAQYISLFDARAARQVMMDRRAECARKIKLAKAKERRAEQRVARKAAAAAALVAAEAQAAQDAADAEEAANANPADMDDDAPVL